MEGQEYAERLGELLDSVADSAGIKSFLVEMAALTASVLTSSAGHGIECSVRLVRRRRPTMIRGSTGRAMIVDRAGQTLHEDPYAEALLGGRPVLINDDLTSPRWGDYCKALTAAGFRSALVVPLVLEENAAAALTFYTTAPGLFTRNVISDALDLAESAGKALRVAVRITNLEQLTEDLAADMAGRSVINLACGVIVAQNGCSQDQAFDILRIASSDRNQKLQHVARAVVNGVAGHPE